jgi:pimeloyl-ACP methyl ester carboxylesterase
VARFVDRYPDRVRRYVLIAPTGLPYRKGLKQRLLDVPGLGEWLMKAFGDRNIIAALPAEIGDDPAKVRRAVEAYHGQMQFHGYKRAILSTLRYNPLNNALPVYERIGSQPKKGLLVWGTRDTIIPFKNHVRLQAAIPTLRFHPVEGGTHPVCYQRPEAVSPAIVDFLGR